jgi:hypothetical protein
MKSARHKGTCIAPIVAVLRLHPQRDTIVPKHLAKYFDQPVLVSGWYPNDEYFELLQLLSKAFDRKHFGGDPWIRMGVSAAQRDIAGVPDRDMPGKAEGDLRTSQVGVYKQYGAMERGVEGFFQRAAKIWSQYHDTGRYETVGRIPGRTAIVRRMVGFQSTVSGYARLQGAYVEEYARLVGVPMSVSVLRNSAQGDPYSEWLCDLEPSDEARGYVSTHADYVP